MTVINAAVVLRPSPSVWHDARWPAALRSDLGDGLEQGYRRAEAMLAPNELPPEPRTARQSGLEQVAESLGCPATPVPVAIAFSDGVSAQGVPQRACSGCGDCATGCNRGAKRTLLVNYLPAAVTHGAQVFTEVAVQRVERRAHAWRVHAQPTGRGRHLFQAPPLAIEADRVILAGGALGSTEILLRSQGAGLPLSSRLGQGFSGNGTLTGLSLNTDQDIFGVGWGPRDDGPYVGPTITKMIDLRERGMMLQDTAIPRPLADLLGGPLHLAGLLAPSRQGKRRRVKAAQRSLAGLVGGPHSGALHHSLTWAVTSGDSAKGKLELRRDRLRLRWPGAGTSPTMLAGHRQLFEASQALSTPYAPNPAWKYLPRNPPLTVHPLGGCGMGDDAGAGVVDHAGRVFSGPSGTAVHEGLYVCDGSVLPCALGTNPLLTITALAERCAELMLQERPAPPPEARPIVGTWPRRPAPQTPGFRFTERMAGWFSPSVETPRAGERPADATPLSFVLTIEWLDLEALLADHAVEATTTGTLEALSLSPEPLTVTGGRFQLFVGQEDGGLHMVHRMPLVDGAGRAFFLEGHKVIRDDPGPDLWLDTTTLYYSVHAGGQGGPRLGGGLVQVRVRDLLKQVTTLSSPGTSGLAAWRARWRFVSSFLSRTRQVYGGLVLPLVR